MYAEGGFYNYWNADFNIRNTRLQKALILTKASLTSAINRPKYKSNQPTEQFRLIVDRFDPMQ